MKNNWREMRTISVIPLKKMCQQSTNDRRIGRHVVSEIWTHVHHIRTHYNMRKFYLNLSPDLNSLAGKSGTSSKHNTCSCVECWDVT